MHVCVYIYKHLDTQSCLTEQFSMHTCMCVCIYIYTHTLSYSVMSESARLLCPWGFSRQEYWSGLPCPPPGDLPNPGINPRSPTLQVDSLLSKPPVKPTYMYIHIYIYMYVCMYIPYWLNLDRCRN